VRAKTQNVQQRDQEIRGVGEGRTKQWGTEIWGDLCKGEGWDGEHGYTRWTLQGLSDGE